MFKKILALIVACIMCVLALASCGETSNDVDLQVGVILVGDETEGYSLAHMIGINTAVEALKAEGISVKVSYKYRIPESADVETNAIDLIADGCSLIITNSYGHQFYWGDTIKNNPDITFVSMTGDLATSTGLNNYFNAFTDVYESRYVSGVVAGMKIKELIDNGTLTKEAYPNAFTADGKVKVGYVGAFNYAEVVSGYTSFFLGIKSVYDNVEMTVKYTNSWFDVQREAAVAEYLLSQGCVIIGQHADSTGAPAAVEKAHNENAGYLCYSVGYNVSMLEVAENVALTSPTNEWDAYYKVLFKAVATGAQVPVDWAEGYSKDAVQITELGKACAKGTAEKVEEDVNGIKNGTIKVFDCAAFTVNGAHITSYTQSYGFEGNECVKTENGVTFFDESSLRSAPYFDIRIDGITEIASDYTD